MKSFTGKFSSVRGWAVLLALLLGAGMIISACGEEEVPAPTTPAPAPAPTPPPAPEPEPTGPATPENLRVTGTTSTSITWSWNAVEGALGYQGQFSTDATFTETDPTFIIVAPATSHTVSNLGGSTTGHFRVRSGTGTSLTDLTYSEWTDGSSGTTAAPPPATALDAPDNVRSTDRSEDSITLEWDDVDDAVSYEVEQREPGGNWGDASCGGGDNVVDEEECVASDLDAGTDYDFRVRGVPADDDSAHLVGAWSDVAETRTGGTAPQPTTAPTSGGMGDLNVQWETTATGITFLWNRVADAEYETFVLETYSDDAEPCDGVTFVAKGRSTSEDVPAVATATDAMVRGLCVQTMDEDNRRLSFAWGVANPWAPTAGTPTVEDGKTTSLPWTGINVVQDFNYAVHVVADSGREDGMFSSGAAPTKAIQEACDGGMRRDDGLADVTLTELTETVDSGIRHFTGYTLCLRYSNDAGSTDWAVPVDGSSNLNEIHTTPAAPTAPRFDRGTNNAAGTERALAWTVPVRNSTDVPREADGFEAFIIQYPVRYDHDGDGGTTALRSTPAPTAKTCGDPSAEPSNLESGGTNPWTRVTGLTLGTSLDGITVATPDGTPIAIPANTAENLSVRLCVRATQDSAGTALDAAVRGPWRIGGATTITKQAPPF